MHPSLLSILFLLLSTTKPQDVENLLDAITHHPILQELRPRSRLKPKHTPLFQQPQDDLLLFNELGVMACSTGVISCKEFLETYAAATHIHHHLLSQGNLHRVADLAAGHGLLGWFLLAMDPTTRSVVCVDPRRPLASLTISQIMTETFSDTIDPLKFRYVATDLKHIQPDPSCLLTSVHACGVLTDQIIQLAIQHNAPLAVVPCCHTVKGASSHMEQLVEERKRTQRHDKHQAVADVLDEIRCQTLRDAGYSVQEVFLPETFTGRNRLILAEPPASSQLQSRVASRPGQMVSNHPRIPLADNPESTFQCHALSQTTLAATPQLSITTPRKQLSLTLHVCLVATKDADEIVQELQFMANKCCKGTLLQCTVAYNGEAQLYSFQYKKADGTKLKGESRGMARAIHHKIRDRLERNDNRGYSIR